MKLRILCLHGYNGSTPYLMKLMQNFMRAFSPVCEFVFLEAPHDGDVGKRWMIPADMTGDEVDKSDVNFTGAWHSAQKVVQFINS